MNSNIKIGPIMAAFILFVTHSAHAQQVVANSAHTDESQVSRSDEKGKASCAENRHGGKTRSEVLVELQQAQANGTAMPTGFVAYDDAAHDAKYKVFTQHSVAN